MPHVDICNKRRKVQCGMIRFFIRLQVMLTGHVPPGFTTPRGVRWMTKAFNKKFIEIVQRHSSVIVAMHFGHEHHDSFRLFYDQKGNSIN